MGAAEESRIQPARGILTESSTCSKNHTTEKKNEIKKRNYTPNRNTVNSRYSEHLRGHGFAVSVIERVRNSGSYSWKFFFAGASTSVRNNGVSIIATSPQGGR